MNKKMRALLALLLVVAMVLPVAPMEAMAARKESQDDINEIPDGARIFFESKDEAYSFNVATYWDIYQTQLGVARGTTQQGTNPVNVGLTLSSSTDSALIPGSGGTGSTGGTYNLSNVTLTADVGKWGDFTAGRVIEHSGVTLQQGDNDIQVVFNSTGADIQRLELWQNGAKVTELAPTASNVSARNEEDNGTVTATDTANGYIDTTGTARYKATAKCLGWMGSSSATYHFRGTSAEPIQAGTYDLKLYYTFGNASNETVPVIFNVNQVSSSLDAAGILRIDYESGRSFEYTQYNNGTARGYSDGTATISGWGGNFTAAAGEGTKRDRAIVSLRVKNGLPLDQIAPYVNFYFVRANGDRVLETTLQQMMAQTTACGADSLVSHFLDGYSSYVTSTMSNEVEGMKIAFLTPEGMNDISGTLEIGYVGITRSWVETADFATYYSDYGHWVDFSPFAYNESKINEYNEYNRALGYNVKPFVRLADGTTPENYDSNKHGTKVGAGEGTTLAGKNISTDNWHLWTMSTSDANIVDEDHGDCNGTGSYNALEIKYQNNGAHKTFARLERAEAKRGQWMAITIKGSDDTLDRNPESQNHMEHIKLVLNKGADDEKTVLLSELKVAPYDEAETFSVFDLQEGYQTLFYNVGGNSEYGLKSVDFDFSDAAVDAAAGNDTHRLYVKEIYLYNPTIEIFKSVNVDTAYAGQEVIYTFEVANSDRTEVTDITVTDLLPAGVTVVDGQNYQTQDVDGRVKVTLATGLTLSPNAKETYSLKVNMPANAQAGDLVTNFAEAAFGDKTVKSNQVQTRIIEKPLPAEYTFYAEVGKETTFPIELSTASKQASGEGEFVTLPVTGGWGSDNLKTVSLGTGYQLVGGVTNTITISHLDNTCVVNVKSLTLKQGDHTIKLTTTADNTLGYEGSDSTNKNNEASFVQTMENSGNGYILTYGNGTEKSGYYSDASTIGQVFKNNDVIKFCFGRNMGITDGTYEVIIEYAGTHYDTAKGLCQVKATASSQTVGGGRDEYASITPAGACKYADSITGDENAIYYEGKQTGVGTLTALTKSGRKFTVTVYNYAVQDHVYVLDYGLPVYLTGTDDTGPAQDIVGFAGLDLFGGEAADGAAFLGFSATKHNDDSIADPDDYQNNGKYTLENLDQLGLKNGVLKVSGESDENLTIDFTPTRFMDSVDTFYYGVQVTKDKEVAKDSTNATPVMEGEIKIMPASIVYYEDNFALNSDDGVNIGGDNEQDGVPEIAVQSNDLNVQYGYDKAYEDDDGYSNGSATEMKGRAYATFKFKGTGFDIVSKTGRDTGTVFAYVYPAAEGTYVENGFVYDSDGARVKSIAVVMVDTYYENATALYQIPVISKDNLEYGQYIVKLSVSSIGGRSFYLDGIRIYNPLGNNDDDAHTDYNKDELNASVIEIREMILGSGFSYDPANPLASTPGTDSKATLVKIGQDNVSYFSGGLTTVENFTINPYETNSGATNDPIVTTNLMAYVLHGPNNELYLEDGYGVVFGYNLTGSDAEAQGIQIGAKAISGTPTLEYRSKDGAWKTVVSNLASATEMYYKLDVTDLYNGAVALRVAGKPGEILSLTNVKYNNCEFSSLGSKLEEYKGWNTPQNSLIKTTPTTLTSKDGVVTITFATDASVEAVKFLNQDKEDIYVRACYYEFSEAGTKTWSVQLKADGTTSVKICAMAGNYLSQSEAITISE